MAKVVLIRLRGKEDIKAAWSESCEPIGLGYIASALRDDGHDVKICDELTGGMSFEEIVDEASCGGYQIAGISVSSQTMWQKCSLVASEIRRKNPLIHITMGGHLPTFMPEHVLMNCPSLDSVVIGEGEFKLQRLTKAIESLGDLSKIEGLCYRLNGHIYLNSPSKGSIGLELYPQMARDLLFKVFEKDLPLANIITSRGCFGSCSYCSMNSFYKRGNICSWRGRPLKDIFDEIEILIKTYGVKHLRFADDSFFGPGTEGIRRAELIAKRLMEMRADVLFSIVCRLDDIRPRLFELLRRAGLNEVFIGVESADREFTERHGKKLRKSDVFSSINQLGSLGLQTLLGFIMFEPYSKVDDIRHNLEFLMSLPAYDLEIEAYLNKLWPITGTVFQKDLNRQGLLKGEFWNLSYQLADPHVALFEKIAFKTVGRWINFDNLGRYHIDHFRYRILTKTARSSLVRIKTELRKRILGTLWELLEEVSTLRKEELEESYPEILKIFNEKAKESCQTLAAMVRLERLELNETVKGKSCCRIL